MIEQFKLILKHEMVIEGCIVKIDDPITISYCTSQIEIARCVSKTEIINRLCILLKEQIERIDNE